MRHQMDYNGQEVPLRQNAAQRGKRVSEAPAFKRGERHKNLEQLIWFEIYGDRFPILRH